MLPAPICPPTCIPQNNIKGYRYQLWCIARQVSSFNSLLTSQLAGVGRWSIPSCPARAGICAPPLRLLLGTSAHTVADALLFGLARSAGSHALLHGACGHPSGRLPGMECCTPR